ncbi:MAG TPA: hypothetical protein VE173_11750, partial [Longimicrobiales bacterium]|nr:hypothetical protein [Longimicrobiales bacterium]
VRVGGVTSFRYIQVRPLKEDSVPVEETRGDGLLRRTGDGVLVRCVAGEAVCRYYRTDERTSTVPGIQDVTVSGWGFGRGVRVYAHLRARTDLGSADDLWPRSEDAFDALAAYVELNRERFRVRVGRDWKTSGLGYYDYDGASILVRATRELTAEAYGGWSLMRGAQTPLTGDALAAIEPFAPDSRAVLLGAQVRYRPTARLALSGMYQREIRSDRLGLYSERATVDAVYTPGPLSVSGSLEADLVGRQVNEARLDVRWSPALAWSLGAFARHHRPFFELWTIWGAFSPVAFDELGLRAAWRRPGSPLRVQVEAARRTYAGTGVGLSFAALRTDGWKLAASADYQVLPGTTLQGGYYGEVASGAGISEGHLAARRTLTEGSWLGVSLTAFQRAYEFRVEEGTVFGAGLEAGYRLDARTRVSGGVTAYRHRTPSDESGVDWSQLRGSLRLEWTLGPEPGLSRDDGGAP